MPISNSLPIEVNYVTHNILAAITQTDVLLIAVAFVFGMIARAITLPPLIGYLFAGFFLLAIGGESGELLHAIADLGITLLLFTIGLKLKLKALAIREVWGVASVHMAMILVLFSALVYGLVLLGLPLLVDLQWQGILLIGFVLSFSSTVFAVKVLDELGAVGSKHGQVAIGILVMQDVVAVAFLVIATGKTPTIWAISLLLLIPFKRYLYGVMSRAGHGELLTLFGFVLALVGAEAFETVGIKGDVGALVMGMLFASHKKAGELSKALLGFKDIFLVGFFLSVGMSALPGWNELLIALIFIMVLPLKWALFFGLFNAFSLRSSTAWRTSFNLANYSEFGLIVGALAVSLGFLDSAWLAVFALALSLSFVVSAPLMRVRDRLYDRWRENLKRYERTNRLNDEQDICLREAKVVVFGMGRVGTAVYDAMAEQHSGQVMGIELNPQKAANHINAGRDVVVGDGTNPDFWEQAKGILNGLETVTLTLPTHEANLAATAQFRRNGYTGLIAATVRFDDESDDLKTAGVDFTFNIYQEAGMGFASDLHKLQNSATNEAVN